VQEKSVVYNLQGTCKRVIRHYSLHVACNFNTP